jgi:hypothetical protein
MIVKMSKETIIRLLENEEMIEYSVVEMPFKEFLIHIETPTIKKMSFITDSWEEIVEAIS